jgi:hypothetical protein
MEDNALMFGALMFLCGMVSGILICIPAKRKGRYYYDDK